ncbi:MAG: DUF3604 domain-containing protein [Halieaceae bacterium]|nr:MAG: DUF3604 domain-containing protein [Halieaceae bacterium]
MPRLTDLAAGIAAAIAVSSSTTHAEMPAYSTGINTDYPKQVFFGDLHLHSNISADAQSMGNLLLTSADAYRFARGEKVVASNGLPAKLKRPLDFLAVTDHAEFMGIYRMFNLQDPRLMSTRLGRAWREKYGTSISKETMEQGPIDDTANNPILEFVVSINDPDPERDGYPQDIRTAIWTDVARTADEFNSPGVFTAFSAYEWTAMYAGNNLHRCVILKDNADVVTDWLPYSAQSSSNPEDLWAALKEYESQTGGEALSIPHNGNLSNGLMWDMVDYEGGAITRDYAEARMRWEPIAEVTQLKGDSETHPSLSPDDPFADFERWDEYNISYTTKTTPDMYPGSYARSALRRGLALERSAGANPYAFGMIGSTDDHTSLATAEEDNFFGKFANSEPGIRTPDSRMAGLNADWELGASGLAAVWAPQNTREDLFASMKRREVYATTGSRIVLRFFGGWDYAPNSVYSPYFETIGYRDGVPMGGELTPQGSDAPTFMVQAMKDPDAANLDQVQIIKGWIDSDGITHEKIYYVALSDDRGIDSATGQPEPVGSTVDLETISFSNTIGAVQLSAQWTDPDFDTGQAAFYYARAIEIPRPRWSEYDRKYFGLDFEDAPRTVQDRAYSSPIWYRP